MAKSPVMIEIRLRWWFTSIYLPLLVWFCRLHNSVPDAAKLNRVIARATKLKVID